MERTFLPGAARQGQTKATTRGFHPSADDALARWMDTRKTLPVGRTAPLFCTLQGGRINAQQVRNLVKRLGAEGRR